MKNTPTPIGSTEQLAAHLSNHRTGRFFIMLRGGARSVKTIRYESASRMFHVYNHIDGSRQTLSEAELMDGSITHIGTAMIKHAFYADNAT